MKIKHFLNALDEARIVQTIADIESRTSGEIRVFVTHRKYRREEVLARAQEAFANLRVGDTAMRNGVLFFIAPRAQAFSVIGDEAIHAECGQTFWDEIAGTMEDHFRQKNFTDGILAGLHRAGEIMIRHFPRLPDDRNELPDEIITDG